MGAAVVGQVDLPAGGAILNPGWTPTPHPRGSIGVVTVHSSSRGSPRRLARDVGGEHVGRPGGGAPVGRRTPAGRARVGRPGGHAPRPAGRAIPGLGQRHGRRPGAAGLDPGARVDPSEHEFGPKGCGPFC